MVKSTELLKALASVDVLSLCPANFYYVQWVQSQPIAKVYNSNTL